MVRINGCRLIKGLSIVSEILAYFCLSKAIPLRPLSQASGLLTPDGFPVGFPSITCMSLKQPQWPGLVTMDRPASLNPNKAEPVESGWDESSLQEMGC